MGPIRRLAPALALTLVAGCSSKPLLLPPHIATPSGNAQLATTRAVNADISAITGFRGQDDLLTHRFTSPGGLYSLSVRYRAPSEKAYVLTVNGLAHEGFFLPTGDAFATHTHGLIELPRGQSVLTLGGGWGYFELADITLTPARRPPPPARPPSVPVNPHASPEARALLQTLTRLYGTTTLTGVYSEADIAHVRDRTGHTPALLGGDLMDYSPSRVERGADAKRETERLVAAAQRGHLITVSWHWNAPKDLLDRVDIDESGRETNKRWYKGFHTNATTFNVAAALADPHGDDYRLLLRDIDAIAVELRKLADANVPVLWRPLHEAEGRWFWWGAQGPEPYVQLWRLLYDRLTHHHQLHNLLWVYTAGPDPRWYPGDDVVDLVGVDLYPKDSRDPMTWAWQTVLRQYAGRKLIALTEVGFIPDLQRMRRHGVYWSYFNTWTGNLGPQGQPDADLQERLRQRRYVQGLPLPR